MKKLQDLTHNINQWNMLGLKPLPPLEIVIIYNSTKEIQLKGILQEFKCFDIKIDDELEKTFIMENGVIGKIHVVKGLTDKQIEDEEFRERKKIISKMKRNNSYLFVFFTSQQQTHLHKNQDYLHVFGFTSQYIERNILYEGSKERLYHQILLKFEGIFKYELVICFKKMKERRKDYEQKSKRYIQWKDVLEGKVDSTAFSFLCYKNYSDAMKCSFTGIYTSQNFFGKSMNWKVMELLQQLWTTQGSLLFNEIDHMPLSYIEEEYKMSDYYSIGGFLSDTCFKQIFSPPLFRLRDSIITSANTIKYLILNHLQASISHVFENTSICELYLQKQILVIENICDKFIQNLQKTLNSQIQYLHADGEDFWNFRQLNSSLYTPQQQIYIEIKYIGKAYVRKVYESIRESVPRYIGQNLLKEIVKYFNSESLNTFLDTVRQIPYQIQIKSHQFQKLQNNLKNLREIEKLINFFSLRVNSSYLIKNFHEKKQRQWRRMFGEKEQQQRDKNSNEVAEGQKGVLAWMRRKLLGQNNENKGRRKIKSSQKKENMMNEDEEDEKKKKKVKNSHYIDEKHWLLIINTGKEVDEEKIRLNAMQGFPIRFRSSIWMYLALKSPNYKKIKVDTLLKSESVPELTVIQINKDVMRTYPANLFRYSLKNLLTRVLQAYSILDKQVSYTQGMNMITAIIILVLIGYGRKDNPLVENKKIDQTELQDKTFCILRYLMEDKQIRKLMLVSSQLMTDLFIRIDDKIKELSPKMWEIIQEVGFTCEMIFASPLLSCLTTSRINYQLQLRVIDVIMTTDFLSIYKIIAQFVAHSQFKADKLNIQNTYDFLRNKMYDEVYQIIGDEGVTKIMNNI